MLGTLAFTGKENWASFSFPRGEPCALVVILFSNLLYSGLLIFREKKAKFCGIFRGKFAEKSADFAGFSREKSQNSQKNRPISRDFSGKSQISKDFRGKFLEKSADFMGNLGGKLCQETISKKQPISLDFVWQISLKSINFASI